MNRQHRGFRKFSSDRKTDTTEIIYHTASRVVNNSYDNNELPKFFSQRASKCIYYLKLMFS